MLTPAKSSSLAISLFLCRCRRIKTFFRKTSYSWIIRERDQIVRWRTKKSDFRYLKLSLRLFLSNYICCKLKKGKDYLLSPEISFDLAWLIWNVDLLLLLLLFSNSVVSTHGYIMWVTKIGPSSLGGTNFSIANDMLGKIWVRQNTNEYYNKYINCW